MGTYNRVDASNYARKWALGRNPDFKNYSASAGGGGDCTNFVSQCLLAGGWPMLEGVRRDGYVWWSKTNEASNTWTSAFWFYRFLRNSPRVSACEEDDLVRGDLVQMQIPSASNPDHTMIVTDIVYLSTPDGDEKQVCLAYHSTDTLNGCLSEIKYRFGKNTKFFYWKVKDEFRDVVPLPYRDGPLAVGNKV